MHAVKDGSVDEESCVTDNISIIEGWDSEESVDRPFFFPWDGIDVGSGGRRLSSEESTLTVSTKCSSPTATSIFHEIRNIQRLHGT